MKKNSEQKDEITSVAPDGSNAVVGGSTVTKMYQCVKCEHFYNDNKPCQNCGCKNFYESITVEKKCDICGDGVLVQERIDKPLDGVLCGKCHTDMLTDDDYEEDEFEPCSRCDGHPACEDFGCAYQHGLGHLVHREPGNDW